jgi:hypothetical protein
MKNFLLEFLSIILKEESVLNPFFKGRNLKSIIFSSLGFITPIFFNLVSERIEGI